MRSDHAETGSEEDGLCWHEVAKKSQILLHHSRTSVQPLQSLEARERGGKRPCGSCATQSRLLSWVSQSADTRELTNRMLTSCSKSLVKYMMEERNSSNQLMIWSSLKSNTNCYFQDHKNNLIKINKEYSILHWLHVVCKGKSQSS